MTTAAKLDKIAAEWFTPEMESLGFLRIKRGYYIRKRPPLHDVIFWYLLSSGQSLRVYATCWTPAGYSQEELKNYPECIGVVLGGSLTESGFQRDVWGVGNDELDRNVLRRLHMAVKEHAIPWFDTIKNADDYLERFRWMRDLDPEFRERVKAQLPAMFSGSDKGSE